MSGPMSGARPHPLEQADKSPVFNWVRMTAAAAYRVRQINASQEMEGN